MAVSRLKFLKGYFPLKCMYGFIWALSAPWPRAWILKINEIIFGVNTYKATRIVVPQSFSITKRL